MRSRDCLLLLIWCLASMQALGQEPKVPTTEAVQAAFEEGNWAEALDASRARLNALVAESKDLATAINCLQRLNRVGAMDRVLERVAQDYANDPAMLVQVAKSYRSLPKQGYMLAGDFHRGRQRGGGNTFNCIATDRVQAIRTAYAAVEIADSNAERAQACRVLAEAILSGRKHSHSWRLQKLTDLSAVPEPIKGWNEPVPSSPPPVTDEGEPLFYEIPDVWDAARNDGERWRWVLSELVKADPKTKEKSEIAYADFLYEQFSVQTVMYSTQETVFGDDPQAALRELADSETIAKLATGVKRFTLPEGHRYLDIYSRHNRWRRVAEIRLNRQQRSRAAEAYAQALELASKKKDKENLQKRIDQILNPWVQFESTRTQPADEGTALRIRHRNAEEIEFTARGINHRQLIADVVEKLRSSPKELDHRDTQIENLSWRLIHGDGEKYLGDVIAEWRHTTTPAEDHADTTEAVATPLQEAGAYLITAKPAGGEASQIILWIADTVLVEKRTTEGALYSLLDSRNGRPIEDATVELFGYRDRGTETTPDGTFRRLGIETRRDSEKTDEDGLVEFNTTKGQDEGRFNWLVTAHKEDRFAFLGFNSMWRSYREDLPNIGVRTYFVTDRPVYRPGDKVEFKAWVARPDYSIEPEEFESEFAHQSFQLELQDARGDKTWTKTLTANAYGGLVGTIELPLDASLGRYHLTLVGYGGGAFRVEEYRKPEFEVTVEAPEEPVRLGEKFEAIVRADYYFGSPVTNASVKYKVTRTRRTDFWFPIRPWDWLYGSGYGWVTPEAAWHSTWRSWRCYIPTPSWWPQPQAPPEVVAEGQAELGPDGTLRLPIDTSMAKQRWPDDDHSYSITAEVTDASRRTITGAGSVLAARRAAEAVLLLDRGHYEVDDTIHATIHVRTPDGKPIAGKGTLRLLTISAPHDQHGADAESPHETEENEVQVWDLETGPEGHAEMRMKASQPGRYRVVYQSDAIEGERIEGGLVFTILGPGFDGAGFQFGALEIVPDKSEYQVGDTARLLVSTDRVGSVVALYTRPTNGVYTKPQVIRLEGQCEVIEVPILSSDQPNFFVEGLTVLDGRVHTVTKQLIVPPAPRVIHVEAVASSDAYLPGQEGTIKVRLTNEVGEPLTGEATIAVYDKSVEAIAPDMLPNDIRKRFWGWRRRHHAQTRHSLARHGYPFTGKDVPVMKQLSAIGQKGKGRSFARGRMMLGAGLEMAEGVAPMAMPMAAAAAGGAAAESETPHVRTNFADTALWIGSVVTDAEGFAELPITMPESLTAWKVRVWAMGDGVRVGQGTTEVVTRKELMVRLQTPRFLVETDEAVLSALVNNYLDAPQSVRVRLEVAGSGLESPTMPEQIVLVESEGEARIDWRVKATAEGVAELTVSAIATSNEVASEEEQTATASDAMRLNLPVLIHGAEIVESFNDVIGLEERLATFELVVPEERRTEATRLEVSYSTTLVGAMLRPLPYLVEYPHGCTEQTLNRFLPAVIVQKTLQDLGVDVEDLPPGGPAQQAISDSPIGDAAELRRIVKTGVRRLDEMQLSDGGWGWFSGFGERSSPHTTAVVVRGLIIARENGVAVPDGVIERGLDWLEAWRDEQLRRLANVDDEGQVIDEDLPSKRAADNTDALIALVLAEAGRFNQPMRDQLFEDRLKLSPYCLATLALTLHLEAVQTNSDQHLIGLRDRTTKNLLQFVVEDEENQTAYLNLPGGMWWYWYGSEFETHAYFLKLLCATKPKGELASRIVKYLVNNRRNATRWNSTRDTALVIEALADYARASGEAVPADQEQEPTEIEVWIDGQQRQQVAVTPADALLFEGAYQLLGDELAGGRHTLELRKKGPGQLYVAASLTNFSLEEELRAAGLEVRVARRVTKLIPIEATADEVDSRGGVVDIAIEKYRHVDLSNLSTVKSGDLIEVELILTSKNDYEYLIIEDPKPAGFEPVEARSGYHGNDLGAYIEFRDERVVFYASRLMRGEHSVRYRLRAETPGTFAALPTQISAMYAPELRGNSDEIRLSVEE